MVYIKTSKKDSPSLHWISAAKTGKARASIKRYWQDKNKDIILAEKEYSSTLLIDLPHKPGTLGEVSTLIGLHKGNIINVELIQKQRNYLQFSFDLKIKDL